MGRSIMIRNSLTGFIFSISPLPVLLVALFIPLPLVADDFTLEGNLKIFKKGGKIPLKSFDNAVVFLEGISTPAPKEPAQIGQRDKKFRPRVLPVIQGQTVRFNNWDEYEHNAFSTDKRNSFDLGRYPRGNYRDQVYDEPGTYKVYCNIHKAMIMDIVVVPNRYHAVTDEQGNYRIPNVPPGNYTLKAWHIYGGSANSPITVSQDMAVPELILNSRRIVREIEDHANKYGDHYKQDSTDSNDYY